MKSLWKELKKTLIRNRLLLTLNYGKKILRSKITPIDWGYFIIAAREGFEPSRREKSDLGD